MTNPSGGTPVVYEDRTLFPTPIQEEQRRAPPPPQKTGLSLAGVLVVAALAAGVAAGVMYVLSPVPVGPAPVAQTEPCVPLNTITVNSDTGKFCTTAEWAKYDSERNAQGTQKEIEEQRAELAALSKYQTLANAELDVKTQYSDVEEAIKEAVAAGIGGKTLEDMQKLPEAPPEWRDKTEVGLRQYAQDLKSKASDIRKQIDDIRLARARQAGVNSVDRETCDTPGGCD